MMRRKAFTLIELLIVVAIIAILAAIAVPNFLEAQSRAKVARAKADIRTLVMAVQTYIVDYNRCFPDNNDANTPPWRKGNWWYTKENPNSPADMTFLNNGSHWMENFYTRAVFIPLTTPISYLSTVPLDPFSKVVPMGIDTREVTVNGAAYYAYLALFSGGPDRTEGNWYRGIAGQNNMGIEYDPTNGSVSQGDVTRVIPVRDGTMGRKEYPFATLN